MEHLITMQLSENFGEYSLTANESTPIMNVCAHDVVICASSQPSLNAVIDEFLNKCEYYFVDPYLFDWEPFARTNSQIIRCSELHQHIDDVFSALVAIYSADPDVYFSVNNWDVMIPAFCEEHSIQLGTATPYEIYTWQSMADEIVEYIASKK